MRDAPAFQRRLRSLNFAPKQNLQEHCNCLKMIRREAIALLLALAVVGPAVAHTTSRVLLEDPPQEDPTPAADPAEVPVVVDPPAPGPTQPADTITNTSVTISDALPEVPIVKVVGEFGEWAHARGKIGQGTQGQEGQEIIPSC